MTVARPSFIYVVEAQCGRVKIGVSRSPSSRAYCITQHSPFPCRLVAVWPGNMKDEQALHGRFQAQRSHNEWFVAVGPVADFLSEVTGTGVTSVPDWDEISYSAIRDKFAASRPSRVAAMRAKWADPEWRRSLVIERRIGAAWRKLPEPPSDELRLKQVRELRARIAAEYDAEFASTEAA